MPKEVRSDVKVLSPYAFYFTDYISFVFQVEIWISRDRSFKVIRSVIIFNWVLTPEKVWSEWEYVFENAFFPLGIKNDLAIKRILRILDSEVIIKVESSFPVHQPGDLCLWRPYLNVMTPFKFYNQRPVAMTTCRVCSNFRSILKRTMNMKVVMVFAPHLIASDWWVVGDLLYCYFVLAKPSLISLSQHWIEGLSHLYSELPITHCIRYYKLKPF